VVPPDRDTRVMHPLTASLFPHSATLTGSVGQRFRPATTCAAPDCGRERARRRAWFPASLTSAGRGRRTAPETSTDRGWRGRDGARDQLLNLIDIELDSSFLVLARNMGVRVKAPTFGFLILGGETRSWSTPREERGDHARLAWRAGSRRSRCSRRSSPTSAWLEGRALGSAHAPAHRPRGSGRRFPESTTVVINRRELEHSVSG